MISEYKLVSIKEIKSKSLLKKFDCEVEPLNTFLSGHALKNDELGIGKTFVAVNDDGKICGYFTLSTAQISYKEIPDEYKVRLPKYPIPAIRIARLAVSKDMKGKGLGKDFLKQAFMKIVHVSDITGVYFILVDAKETSKTFYEHYGFIKLNDNELCYFILVDTVKRAIEG